MEKYMKIALKEAEKAKKHNDVPVGAVIVKNNKIISRGHNRRELTKKVTKHAEIVAIERACRKLRSWHLENCEIYVTVEPCTMCYGAIEQARMSKIIYGIDNKKFGYFSRNNENKKILIEKGILKKECENIMKEFFVKKRK